MTDNLRSAVRQVSHKLPYERPELLKFGHVDELTQAVGMSGEGDGSGAAQLKTG